MDFEELLTELERRCEDMTGPMSTTVSVVTFEFVKHSAVSLTFRVLADVIHAEPQPEPNVY